MFIFEPKPYVVMNPLIAKGDFDPIYHTPVIKVIMAKDELSFRNKKVSPPMKAMVDTGSYLCWCKKRFIKSTMLTETGREDVYLFSTTETRAVSKFTASIYIDGNGIINNVDLAELEEDAIFDFIIGTNLLSLFKFVYDGKERSFTLEHL